MRPGGQIEADRPTETTVGRASDTVVRALEAQIASGALPEGAYLPAERELMDAFAISRSVVREAIATLASRGLVESRPRFRPVVRRPSYDAALIAVGGVVTHLLSERDGVRNLYETRIFVEAALARQAACSARKEDIAALRAALDENEAAIPDSELFYATDVAFHAALYALPRNPVFPAVHGAFTSWLSRHWLKMPRSPERNRVNWLSHREIFRAVLERDPDAAEAALRAHLQSAWEYVRGTFEET